MTPLWHPSPELGGPSSPAYHPRRGPLSARRGVNCLDLVESGRRAATASAVEGSAFEVATDRTDTLAMKIEDHCLLSAEWTLFVRAIRFHEEARFAEQKPGRGLPSFRLPHRPRGMLPPSFSTRATYSRLVKEL